MYVCMCMCVCVYVYMCMCMHVCVRLPLGGRRGIAFLRAQPVQPGISGGELSVRIQTIARRRDDGTIRLQHPTRLVRDRRAARRAHCTHIAGVLRALVLFRPPRAIWILVHACGGGPAANHHRREGRGLPRLDQRATWIGAVPFPGLAHSHRACVRYHGPRSIHSARVRDIKTEHERGRGDCPRREMGRGLVRGLLRRRLPRSFHLAHFQHVGIREASGSTSWRVATC